MSDRHSPREDRAARLAAALRANLHRRKAQARATAQGAEDTAPPDPAATDDQPDQ